MDWANVWLTDEMTDRLTDGQIKRMIDWLIDWPTSCRTDPLARSRWSALRTFATSKIDVVKKFRFNHRQLHRLLPISERPSKMWAQCNLRKYVIFSILICSFNAASSSSHHGRGGWKGKGKMEGKGEDGRGGCGFTDLSAVACKRIHAIHRKPYTSS